MLKKHPQRRTHASARGVVRRAQDSALHHSFGVSQRGGARCISRSSRVRSPGVAPAATPVAPQLISRVASGVLGVGLIAAILAAVYLAAGAANARPGAQAQPYGSYPPRDVAMLAPGERTRLLREMQRAPPR